MRANEPLKAPEPYLRQISYSLGALLLVTATATIAFQSGFCGYKRCGLLADGPYGNLIVGELVSIADNDDLKTIYSWAKKHGLWRILPADFDTYAADVKAVAIAVPPQDSKTPVTVFLDLPEFSGGNYLVGDLVRYSPHRQGYETPPKDADARALQKGLTGCVATLCRSEDSECFSRYKRGVFEFTTGRQIRLATGKPVPNGTTIDTLTMFPKD